MKNIHFLTSLILLLITSLSYGQFTVVPQTAPTINLNGNWSFNNSYSGLPEKINYKSNGWTSIEVPGEWQLQGYKVEPGKSAVYSKIITVPKNWKKSQIFLRCDAIFSKADILINGKNAGTHTGPMVAFEKKITPLIKAGKKNRITLIVKSETLSDTLMSGSQYAAHQLGGILRKIYLFAVPNVYLKNLYVTTQLDKDYKNALLNISGILNNTSNKNSAEVIIDLLNTKGEKLILKNNHYKAELKNNAEHKINISIPIKNPDKWNAEHPYLYTLIININSKSGEEQIKKKIGFRQIEIVGNQLYINGVPIKLKGVNRHEVHPLRGRSLTPSLWKKDAELFKNGNVNYIRTSHYPPAEEFIEFCDSIGLYVELENPICWVGHGANNHWKKNDPKDPTLYPYFEKIAKTNISFFRNHPSIILWSMANESMWTKNWSDLADFYSIYDPFRPATFHDQAYGNFNNYGSTKMPIANIHYPGPGGPKYVENFKRPILFGEYAHINTYNREEIATDPGVRDAWGRGFKNMWEAMYKSRGCLGGAIWSGIDDVFYMPDKRAVGYGEWGPIDGWRRQKPEYFHMKKTYSPIKIHNRHVAVPKKGGTINLQIENRFDFTNLNECKITWEIENKKGTKTLDLAPKNTGILSINPDIKNLNGKILTIKIISPQNIEVEACFIEIGDVQRDDFPFNKINTSTLKTFLNKNILNIKGDNFSWSFNLKTGILEEAQVNGDKILNNGAELMMLKLKTGACNTEHSLNIPVHNSICSGKTIEKVNWNHNNDTVSVGVLLKYDQAKGKITYNFTKNGDVTINYQMTSKININPRQWGLVFSMQKDCKNLQWYRRGLWSWYPKNHIGRTNGSAIPFGNNANFIESFGQIPKYDWLYDANNLGTNDFRATRENIYWAALSNPRGNGITVLSDGTQNFRAFVDQQKKICFLITGYSTGGGDMFFSGHYNSERKKIKKGEQFNSTVKLQLVEK